jgi:hypothetical protein
MLTLFTSADKNSHKSVPCIWIMTYKAVRKAICKAMRKSECILVHLLHCPSAYTNSARASAAP